MSQSCCVGLASLEHDLDVLVAKMDSMEMAMHMLKDTFAGQGAIPLHGRQFRKEPCRGCRIDLSKPLTPDNIIATTHDAIGTLTHQETKDWCSVLEEETNGRCYRAREIHKAANECHEKYGDDNYEFFKCFTPAFTAHYPGNIA